MDRPGIDNFWDILQQIFLFEYFLPQDKRKLTRKQIQNALGIQQARWSTDPANVDRDERILRPVRFVYYEDVVASPDSLMNVEICRLMRYKYYDERYRDQKNHSTYVLQDSLKKKVYNLLRKTVWYIFDDHDFLDTVTPKGFWFSIPGGHKREYNLYPLPESFNTLCDLMCFHNFDLVFGTFSGYSMLKYYLFQEKRPMNCHLPASKGNMTHAHKLKLDILNGWTHDIYHEALYGCSSSDSLEKLNKAIEEFREEEEEKGDYPFEDSVVLTNNNIREQVKDPKSEINYFAEQMQRNGSFNDDTFVLNRINDFASVYKDSNRTRCFRDSVKRSSPGRSPRASPGRSPRRSTRSKHSPSFLSFK